jgi:hypothetical protein
MVGNMKLQIVERDGFYGIRKKFLGIFSFYYLIHLEEWTPLRTIHYFDLERVKDAVKKLSYKQTPEYKTESGKIKIITEYET